MAYDPKLRAKMKADREREAFKAEMKRRDELARQPPSEGWLTSLRQAYADTWTKDAIAFEQGGHYSWMADQIPVRGRALEIGCGDGRSTFALVGSGQTVVSVEENTACIDQAIQLLGTNGVNANVERRGTTTFAPPTYTISYAAPNVLPFQKPVTIVEGDTLADPALDAWLAKIAPFDVVVCWLLGSHNARHANTGLARYDFNDSLIYRLKTQNLVYELADRVLRSGGYLHCVDRGEVPNTNLLRDDVMNAHRDQASVTSLQVETLSYREYDASAGAFAMQFSPGLSGRVPKKIRPALISVLAKKA